uniref:HTH psq-type domain-containing protein n=1 Tax=Anopheles quadriannulatus TaxID=34691 RepID=A0A182X771_ANOQN
MFYAESYQYQLQSMWQKCWNSQNLIHHLRFRERGPLKSWRPETMAEAIFSVLKEGLSLSQAARKYDIPYPTFVLYANRVHNMLGPSIDGGTDLRPKGRGRPQRILLGIWPDDHIKGVIKSVVFRDAKEMKEEPMMYGRHSQHHHQHQHHHQPHHGHAHHLPHHNPLSHLVGSGGASGALSITKLGSPGSAHDLRISNSPDESPLASPIGLAMEPAVNLALGAGGTQPGPEDVRLHVPPPYGSKPPSRGGGAPSTGYTSNSSPPRPEHLFQDQDIAALVATTRAACPPSRVPDYKDTAVRPTASIKVEPLTECRGD